MNPLQRVPGKPWPKGVSGNPSGKRKGSVSLTAAIKRILIAEPEQVEAIARTLIRGAIAGDVQMARLLFERVDGHRSNPFFSVAIDNSDRRTAISISPQVLAEIAESRRKYESEKACPHSPTT